MKVVSIMDDDECVRVIGPTADSQQLSGHLNSPMVGTGIAATAPNFHLQIPVRVGHEAFSLPGGRYSQMVAWPGSWDTMGKTSSRRRRPLPMPGKLTATV